VNRKRERNWAQLGSLLATTSVRQDARLEAEAKKIFAESKPFSLTKAELELFLSNPLTQFQMAQATEPAFEMQT